MLVTACWLPLGGVDYGYAMLVTACWLPLGGVGNGFAMLLTACWCGYAQFGHKVTKKIPHLQALRDIFLENCVFCKCPLNFCPICADYIGAVYQRVGNLFSRRIEQKVYILRIYSIC